MKTKELNTPSDVRAFMASKDRNIASPSNSYPKVTEGIEAVGFAEARPGHPKFEKLTGRVVR